MTLRRDGERPATRSHPLIGSVILLYFVIALEVLIMISPFAAFFYAVFDPVLLFLARSPATRWLAAFFLPHMVLPPGLFLKAIRVAGSVLFVVGTIVFLACAGQVYSGKLLRRGPASAASTGGSATRSTWRSPSRAWASRSSGRDS